MCDTGFVRVWGREAVTFVGPGGCRGVGRVGGVGGACGVGGGGGGGGGWDLFGLERRGCPSGCECFSKQGRTSPNFY